MGSQRVRHDWVTFTFFSHLIIISVKWCYQKNLERIGVVWLDSFYIKVRYAQGALVLFPLGFLAGHSGEEPPCQSRRWRFHPWVGKIPWGGNGSPLQYPCLGNPIDRGAWRATVYGVSQSRTRLNNETTTWTWIHQVLQNKFKGKWHHIYFFKEKNRKWNWEPEMEYRLWLLAHPPRLLYKNLIQWENSHSHIPLLNIDLACDLVLVRINIWAQRVQQKWILESERLKYQRCALKKTT